MSPSSSLPASELCLEIFLLEISSPKPRQLLIFSPKDVTSFANSLLNPGVLASTVEDTEREETHGLKAKHIDRTDGPFCRNWEDARAAMYVLQRWMRANQLVQCFKLTLISPMRLHLQDILCMDY